MVYICVQVILKHGWRLTFYIVASQYQLCGLKDVPTS